MLQVWIPGAHWCLVMELPVMGRYLTATNTPPTTIGGSWSLTMYLVCHSGVRVCLLVTWFFRHWVLICPNPGGRVLVRMVKLTFASF